MTGSKPPPPPSAVPLPVPGRIKLSYNDQRDLERLPAEIDRLQSEIDRTEHELHDSGLYGRDPRRFIELTERAAKLRAEKEATELRWLEVAELAEQLQRQAG